jgi:hypothetical protein
MVCPDVIVIDAGTNNIRRGISTTEIMGDTMDLVEQNILAKPITNVEHLNLDEHFKVSIVKLVHFKIIIVCIYRNPNSNIQIMLDSLEIILDYK